MVPTGGFTRIARPRLQIQGNYCVGAPLGAWASCWSEGGDERTWSDSWTTEKLLLAELGQFGDDHEEFERA